MIHTKLKVDEKFLEFVQAGRLMPGPSGEKGIRYLFIFPSVGYGASVIKKYGSFGYEEDQWELATIKQNENGGWGFFNSTEDPMTEFLGGVHGFLTDKEVNTILEDLFNGDDRLTHYYQIRKKSRW